MRLSRNAHLSVAHSASARSSLPRPDFAQVSARLTTSPWKRPVARARGDAAGCAPTPARRTADCAANWPAPRHGRGFAAGARAGLEAFQQAFVACLQSARRGSAAGPSGTTNEHLRIMLDDEEDSRLLHNAAKLLARAQVPDDVLAAVRVGKVVALQEPNGRVRALVVGNVLRHLVGRVLAQQFGPQLQEACLPFQFGLSTSAGTEAVVCLLRAATEASPRATILSVDAVGAFDHLSRGLCCPTRANSTPRAVPTLGMTMPGTAIASSKAKATSKATL